MIELSSEMLGRHRKVGTHRRIPFAKALEYKRKLEADRRATLAELVAYDQEIGL
jgi:hypothetical protein